MSREPNYSQPVLFLSRGQKLVLAVIPKDDGSRGGPGDINAIKILEVRVSSTDFVRARRTIDGLRRGRASDGRSSPPAKPRTGQSRAAQEFPEFEQGSGV
jgi:hypothetical protein